MTLSSPNIYYRFIYFNSRGAGELIRLLLNIPPTVHNAYAALPASYKTTKNTSSKQPLILPQWEDIRYPLNLSKQGFSIDAQYQKHKEEGAFVCNMNKLPILQVIQYEDDDTPENKANITNLKVIGQSHSIARFISTQHGFMGKDPMQEAYIDNIYENLRDMKSQWFRKVKQIKTNRHENKLKFLKQELPALCLQLEKSLPSPSKACFEDGAKPPWLIGSTISLADVSLYHMLSTSQSLTTGSTISFFDGESELVQKAYVDCPRLKTSLEAVAALPSIQSWEERRPDTVS